MGRNSGALGCSWLEKLRPVPHLFSNSLFELRLKLGLVHESGAVPGRLAEDVVHRELEGLKEDVLEVSAAAHQLSGVLLDREAASLHVGSKWHLAAGLAFALAGAR